VGTVEGRGDVVVPGFPHLRQSSLHLDLLLGAVEGMCHVVVPGFLDPWGSPLHSEQVGGDCRGEGNGGFPLTASLFAHFRGRP